MSWRVDWEATWSGGTEGVNSQAVTRPLDQFQIPRIERLNEDRFEATEQSPQGRGLTLIDNIKSSGLFEPSQEFEQDECFIVSKFDPSHCALTKCWVVLDC
jgi:hypothetical protein